MNKVVVKTAVIGVAALALLSVQAMGQGGKKVELKAVMGDNFVRMQLIQAALITADYSNLLENVNYIRQHAKDIDKLKPADIRGKPLEKVFDNYTQNLVVTADHLYTVSKELQVHDQKKPGGQLDIDYLRAVAASHYGQLVSTCVICHNQFRRWVVK